MLRQMSKQVKMQIGVARIGCFLLALLFANALQSQEIYRHVNNIVIYEFLDELANEGVIELESVAKPYSRRFIAEKLTEAKGKTSELNRRQLAEIDFYLLDYGKTLHPERADKKDRRRDLLYYKDSLFDITVNVIGGMYTRSNANNVPVYHRWNGAEFYGHIGENVGYYANLRDNFQTKIAAPDSFLTSETGNTFKSIGAESGGEFSDMRGGITYSWKWGTVALMKDHLVWGNHNFGSNIRSGREPSVPQFIMRIKPTSWLEFHYVHSWLVSTVIDSLRSYPNGSGTGLRNVEHPKYYAGNMFIVRPWKKLSLTVGNSIIYSSNGVEAGYLVPVLFYKSVDHTLNNISGNNLGQNAQLFLDISSRQIKHLHLFMSVYLDEIDIGNSRDPDLHSNFYSLKLGGRLSNWPLQNLSLFAEYNRTNPIVYRHFISTTDYASSKYNLGHYLGDNSDVVDLAIQARPIKKLRIALNWNYSRKGTVEEYDGTFRSGLGKPFMRDVIWSRQELALDTRYEVINDGWLRAGIAYSDYQGDALDNYSLRFYHGQQWTFTFGANFGL